MTSIDTLAAFFGWSTAINLALLMFACLLLTAFRERYSKIHMHWFGLSKEEVSRAYFQFIAQYKLAIFVFNLAPYCALKIVGQ